MGDLAPELEQRLLMVLLLGAAAVLGERHAESSIRAADSIYSLAAGWGSVALFAVRSPRTAPCSALFASGIFYVGMRIVVQAMSHSAEVLAFRVTRDDVSSGGYALSDCVASTALAFGGSCCACCGLAVLANDRLVEAKGTRVLAPAVSQIGGMAFAAALVAQLSMYTSLDSLPAIFSASSCAGDHCEAARRARRFYIANSHVGALWACVVGMVVFAVPLSRARVLADGTTGGARQEDNVESLAYAYYYESARIPSAAAVFAAAVSTVVVVAVIFFADQEGSFATAEVTVLYLSIPAVWFVSSLLGCALFVIGNALYIQSRLGSVFGFELRYFTHWSLAASTVLAALLLGTTAVSWVGYSCAASWKPARQRFAYVEIATAGLTIALVSVQLALTLLTLSLFAAFDGSLVGTELSFRQQGFEFTLQHSISFFFAAALYGSRFEVAWYALFTRTRTFRLPSPPFPVSPARARFGTFVLLLRLRVSWRDGGVDNRERLGKNVRRYCYYGLPPVLGVCWLLTLLVSDSDSPYEGGTSWHFFIGIVAAGVPWLIVGVGV